MTPMVRAESPGTPLPRLTALLGSGRLQPQFQPVVDLFACRPMGYEVLSRVEGVPSSPASLFAAAREQGLLWELEQACREAVFEVLAAGPEAHRSGCYFLNVTPEVFLDRRFPRDLSRDRLAARGLADAHLVLEITERSVIDDAARFKQLVDRLDREGFRLALDDFGAGHSSLLTLITATPHYIKLDRAVIHGLASDQYKQQLVASIVSFASGVDTRLIAEGVESWDDLAALMRLGVRYAQGFLFASPQDMPCGLSEDVARRLAALSASLAGDRDGSGETIASMVIRRQTLRRGECTGGEIAQRFLHDSSLDHLVLLHEDRPVGLITRQQLFLKTAGPVGFSLYQNRPAEMIAHPHPLTVQDQMPVTTLAKLAMDRPQNELYEPVVVTDRQGRFLGTVTIKQLLARATQLEIESAHAANPLTGLPGNRAIQAWIRDALARRPMSPFSIVYADLDHFKEYNDAYGFLMGDEMIRLAASVLGQLEAHCNAPVRLGHVGGDDFVAVCPSVLLDEALTRVTASFDEQKVRFFKPRHRKEGCFPATDRQGHTRDVPLVTLSLAVIDSRAFDQAVHPGLLSQIAASLKKKAKALSAEQGRSCHLIEQRSYRHDHEAADAPVIHPS